MRVLYVDDNRELLLRAEAKIKELGHVVMTADSYARTKEILADKENRIQLVIADHMMEGEEGFNFVLGLQQAFPSVKVCVLTTDLTRSEANQLEMGNIPYFVKPILLDKVLKEMRIAPPVAKKAAPEVPTTQKKGEGLLGLDPKKKKRKSFTKFFLGEYDDEKEEAK